MLFHIHLILMFSGHAPVVIIAKERRNTEKKIQRAPSLITIYMMPLIFALYTIIVMRVCVCVFNDDDDDSGIQNFIPKIVFK